jgi:hypothetical protein
MALVRIDNRKDAHLKHHVVVQVGCEVDHLGSKQLTTVNGGSESWQTALYRWSRPRFSLLRNRTTIATIPSLSHAHLDHVTKVHVLAPAARQGVLDALESPKKIENLLVLQDRVVVDNTVDRSVQAVVEAKDVPPAVGCASKISQPRQLLKKQNFWFLCIPGDGSNSSTSSRFSTS